MTAPFSSLAEDLMRSVEDSSLSWESATYNQKRFVMTNCIVMPFWPFLVNLETQSHKQKNIEIRLLNYSVYSK